MNQTHHEDKLHKLVVLSSGYPSEDGTLLKHTFVQGFVNEARHYYEHVEVISDWSGRPRVVHARKVEDIHA